MGPNIRSGAHYTQFIVFDFDGDGRAELAAKTADGTTDGAGTVIGDAAADWVDLSSGNQALADSMVSFDCRLIEARLVGTHNILIGEVVEIRSRRDGHALLYFDRNYVHVPTQAGSFGG